MNLWSTLSFAFWDFFDFGDPLKLMRPTKKGEILNIWPLCTTLKTRHWVDLFKNIVLYPMWPHLLHCISLFLWRQKDCYSSKNKRRDWCVLREKCARKTCWLVAMVSFNTFDILIIYIYLHDYGYFKYSIVSTFMQIFV